MYMDFNPLLDKFQKEVANALDAVRRDKLRKYRADQEVHDGMVDVPAFFLQRLLMPLTYTTAGFDNYANYQELVEWCNEQRYATTTIRLPADAVGRWIDRFGDTPYLTREDFAKGLRCAHLVRYGRFYRGCATCANYETWLSEQQVLHTTEEKLPDVPAVVDVPSITQSSEAQKFDHSKFVHTKEFIAQLHTDLEDE